MSSATARTCATIISGGTGWMASTPTVFWAVIAVIAVMPCTPQRANAFRSAWMPAPPPESEPAIERTAGTRAAGMRIRLGGGLIAASERAADQAAELQLAEAGEHRPGLVGARGELPERPAPLLDRLEQPAQLGPQA